MRYVWIVAAVLVGAGVGWGLSGWGMGTPPRGFDSMAELADMSGSELAAYRSVPDDLVLPAGLEGDNRVRVAQVPRGRWTISRPLVVIDKPACNHDQGRAHIETRVPHAFMEWVREVDPRPVKTWATHAQTDAPESPVWLVFSAFVGGAEDPAPLDGMPIPVEVRTRCA